MDEQEFWLVWNPDGVRPPSRQHLNVASASDEAERLAASRPGHNFYVLHAVEVRRAGVVPVEKVALVQRIDPEDDEIPF